MAQEDGGRRLTGRAGRRDGARGSPTTEIPFMALSMSILIARSSGYAGVAHVAVSVPRIDQQLEAPTPFFVPAEPGAATPPAKIGRPVVRVSARTLRRFRARRDRRFETCVPTDTP